jgi:hypothetical protein
MELTILQIYPLTMYVLLVSPMHGTWPTHLNLLDFMTPMIFIEQYINETPPYATFSYLLLLSASEAKVLSLAPCFPTPSDYVQPLI